jgi:hypothetical protein
MTRRARCLWTEFQSWFRGEYRPELHYMRGGRTVGCRSLSR